MDKVSTVLAAILSLTALCCTSNQPGAEADLIRFDLDKRNPERLLRFYMGSYDDADVDSVLVIEDDRIFGRRTFFDGYSEVSIDPSGDGVVDFDELSAWVGATYNLARRFPLTLADLYRGIGHPDAESGEWFPVRLQGVMTTDERRLFVRTDAVRSALEHFVAEGAMLYPAGTTIVGEHWSSGARSETTVMKKRTDGYWDFFVYGSDDSLAVRTLPRPKSLAAPVQCVGCHLGTRPFEPERSFPQAAKEGPNGPRALLAPRVPVSDALVSRLNEHRRRSDTVLGMYGTLYLGELLQRRVTENIDARDESLLRALELVE